MKAGDRVKYLITDEGFTGLTPGLTGTVVKMDDPFVWVAFDTKPVSKSGKTHDTIGVCTGELELL